MKKLIVISIILVFFSLSWGQISMGVTGGINFTNYGGGDVNQINPNSKAGIAGGIFAELKILNLSVAPELLYVQAGAKYDGDILGNPASIEDKLQYFQIPILARFYLPMIILKPYITAGPYYNYLVAAKSKIEISGQTEENDTKDLFKKQDVGVKLGVGVKLAKLSVAARYSLGLSKISKDADVKNKSVELFLSIYF